MIKYITQKKLNFVRFKNITKISEKKDIIKNPIW